MRAAFGLPWRRVPFFALAPLLGVACSSASDKGVDDGTGGGLATVHDAVNAGDDITEAFNTFKAQVGTDKPFRIGYGPSKAFFTEPPVVGASGFPVKGQAVIDIDNHRITATLDDVPATGSFDLYFVKNVEGSGKTALPESTDLMQKIGTFTTNPGTPQGHRILDVLQVPDSIIQYDFDLIVVTRTGSRPDTSRIAIGARTLFEKRLFRAQFSQLTPPVLGDCAPGDTSVRCQLSSEVESLDPLVRRGAQLFFKETFNGNGRTCGTCHRAENNLTLDPAFIATLPSSDPLFVAERTPALATLENSKLLRQLAVIQENTDGLDKNPVLRGVPHTFAMQTSIMRDPDPSVDSFPVEPPDQFTGWGGDGAPGRGTLAEFALGAIVQHATKDLQRRVGQDFRMPTQAELDALEAFQLFTGRQKFVDARPLVFRDSGAVHGQDLFLSFDAGGHCTQCHLDMGSVNHQFGTSQPPALTQNNFNTNVEALTPTFPFDDGFLNPRSDTNPGIPAGDFNVPVLIEAADSGPFFHNNVFPPAPSGNTHTGIEGAVSFYNSKEFKASVFGPLLNINLSETEINDIGAFLRGLNAAENVRQIRKRVTHVRDVRSSGNTAILTVAIADCQDALDDLQQRKSGESAATTPMNPNTIQALQTVKLTLQNAKSAADANRASFMTNALTWLDIAKKDLFTANPNNDF